MKNGENSTKITVEIAFYRNNYKKNRIQINV